MPSNADARREQRAERIRRGLCAEAGCEHPAVPGKKKCQAHLDRDAAKARKAIARAGTEGRCSHDATCDRPPAPGRKYCQYHLDICNKATKARYAADPTKQKTNASDWYKDRKKAGICLASTKDNPCTESVTDGRVYCDKHNEEKNLEARVKGMELRREVIEAYGGVCQCCGAKETDLLQVDHVNGGGNKHRKEIGQSGIYKWLKKRGFPRKDFILLCGSCNWAWGRYGCCPHAKERLVSITAGGVSSFKDPQTGKQVSDAYIASLGKDVS
jgi:hypothetical protein